MADEPNRVKIIEAVRTPLAFLVLGMLVIESILGGLTLRFEMPPAMLLNAVIGLPIGVMLLVIVLAVLRPEALSGTRPWRKHFAHQFADDIFLALEGPLSNLPREDQAEAWVTVADVITSETSNADYAAFCAGVAERLIVKGNLKGRWQKI